MTRASSLQAPFLRRVRVRPERIEAGVYPFDALSYLNDPEFVLEFPAPITFLVGENGSGKSTILEAIAELAGFQVLGGSQQHQLYNTDGDARSPLAGALRAEWLPRVHKGYFFRAESFFNIATYLDAEGNRTRFGGRLHARSHGEAFMDAFDNDMGVRQRAIYLLDEPEAALSPFRQLAFLHVLHDWRMSGNVQAVIATHAPILMAYPNAALYWMTPERIERSAARDTDHTRLMRRFLERPGDYLDEFIDDDKSRHPDGSDA